MLNKPKVFAKYLKSGSEQVLLDFCVSGCTLLYVDGVPVCCFLEFFVGQFNFKIPLFVSLSGILFWRWKSPSLKYFQVYVKKFPLKKPFSNIMVYKGGTSSLICYRPILCIDKSINCDFLSGFHKKIDIIGKLLFWTFIEKRIKAEHT